MLKAGGKKHREPDDCCPRKAKNPWTTTAEADLWHTRTHTLVHTDFGEAPQCTLLTPTLHSLATFVAQPLNNPMDKDQDALAPSHPPSACDANQLSMLLLPYVITKDTFNPCSSGSPLSQPPLLESQVMLSPMNSGHASASSSCLTVE